MPFIAAAQLQLVRYDSIPVTKSGDTLKLAWAGGFNSPQFSQIDLNGDGIKDLFAFERDYNGIVKTFLNQGAEGKIDYTYAPFCRHGFPQLRNWALLADYDCDGKEDIFTNVPFGMAVYRNDYSNQTGLKFTKVTSLLQTSTPGGNEPLYVSPPDIPAIVDIDNDGDLDILTFDILGKFVEYHKNQSIENNGDCSGLEFKLQNRCWGYFSENETNNGITLNDTCDKNVPDPEKARHAGSTLLSLDLNGDAVMDLVLGDIANNNLVELINGGTTKAASMVSTNSQFPSNTNAVDLKTFPAAFYLDVNNNGKKDLLVSPNNPNTSENIKCVWYYDNTGSDENPQFNFTANNFLQGQMIDVGEGAKPAFFDFNSDGLQDIVVGNYGYFTGPGKYSSRLALYRNTGTITKPAFDFVTDDYSDLSSYNLKGIYPAFGDLDGDGFEDLLAGDEDGNIHLFTNTAGEGAPVEFSLTGYKYKNIDVGQTAMPQIIDVNRDGLPDLLIGERSGTMQYFENIGTMTEADFSSVPTNDYFGEIDVMLDCCTGYSTPLMMEDSTGNYMLYVGSEAGNLYLFNDIEDNLTGRFNLVDSLFLNGLHINVSGADINNDGTQELVYGEYAGGIAILKNGTPSFLDIPTLPTQEFSVKLFPNPATAFVNISFEGHISSKNILIEIVNDVGILMLKKKPTTYSKQLVINLSHFHPGIYYVRIITNNYSITKKLVIN